VNEKRTYAKLRAGGQVAATASPLLLSFLRRNDLSQ